MRRCAGGDETDLAEICQFEHLLSEAQMPVMNRIECSAQNANRTTDRLFVRRLQILGWQGQLLQRKPAGIRQHLREKNDKARRCRAIDHAMVIRQR